MALVPLCKRNLDNEEEANNTTHNKNKWKIKQPWPISHVKQEELVTPGSKDYLDKSAPYLVGLLGVPEHPRNLGVQKGAMPDFCLSEVCYYYEHPRIKKAKYGSDKG